MTDKGECSVHTCTRAKEMSHCVCGDDIKGVEIICFITSAPGTKELTRVSAWEEIIINDDVQTGNQSTISNRDILTTSIDLLLDYY